MRLLLEIVSLGAFTVVICLKGLQLLILFRGSRVRQMVVAVAMLGSIGIPWALVYHGVVVKPRQEALLRQALVNGLIDAENEEAKFSVVESVTQTQLDLRIICAADRALQVRTIPEHVLSDAGRQLTESTDKVVTNARLITEKLFSSDLRAQMGTTLEERCAFAERLAGLSAMTGRVVGKRVWHFPLHSGEALELAVNAEKHLQFTRLISTQDAGATR